MQCDSKAQKRALTAAL